MMTLLEQVLNAPKPSQQHYDLVESYLKSASRDCDTPLIRGFLMKAASYAIRTGKYAAVEEDVKRCLSASKLPQILARCDGFSRGQQGQTATGLPTVA